MPDAFVELIPHTHFALNPTTATGLTLTGGEIAAIVTVEDFPVRVRDDGTDPTASAGHLVKVGGEIKVDGNTREASSVQAVRFIDTAAGASTLRVTTYKTK